MYQRPTIGKWEKKKVGVCEEPEKTTLGKKLLLGFGEWGRHCGRGGFL